ncbi:formate dehydrogenase [Hydrogenophaga crassostreae]|uniref:Formate dehydrogenase n=1 Tax=Hydrogenophaga crassostreae TaxID=1763535 RepID=A0A162SUI8_9BURK|nr:formate dehydrogenase subunit delta [Hydrogenophaga crassostreae]AOW12587.1 formate dehydrogenase [Hydrogenophaga crassostreae]OAD40457.1 formate dehydrogenase [Hydrogenophaga crassostreae]
MDIHNLISMANRIGQFFESFSDRTEALEGISNHIRKFWEPRMRQQLLAQLDEPAGEGLRPIVAEAMRAHRDQLV